MVIGTSWGTFTWKYVAEHISPGSLPCSRFKFRANGHGVDSRLSTGGLQQVCCGETARARRALRGPGLHYNGAPPVSWTYGLPSHRAPDAPKSVPRRSMPYTRFADGADLRGPVNIQRLWCSEAVTMTASCRQALTPSCGQPTLRHGPDCSGPYCCSPPNDGG